MTTSGRLWIQPNGSLSFFCCCLSAHPSTLSTFSSFYPIDDGFQRGKTKRVLFLLRSGFLKSSGDICFQTKLKGHRIIIIVFFVIQNNYQFTFMTFPTFPKQLKVVVILVNEISINYFFSSPSYCFKQKVEVVVEVAVAVKKERQWSHFNFQAPTSFFCMHHT